MSHDLDLSNLPMTQVERHVGHLLRAALSTTKVGTGVLLLDGELRFFALEDLLQRLDSADVATFLLETLGLPDDKVVDMIATLYEEVEDEAGGESYESD